MDTQEDHVTIPDGFKYFKDKGTIIFIHGDKEKYTLEAFEKLIDNWTEEIDLAKRMLHYIPENSDIKRSIKIVQTLVENEIKDGVSPYSIAVIGFGNRGSVALFACPEKFKELAGIGCCSTPLSELSHALNNHFLSGKGRKSTPVFISHVTVNSDEIEAQRNFVKEVLSKEFENVEFDCYKDKSEEGSELGKYLHANMLAGLTS